METAVAGFLIAVITAMVTGYFSSIVTVRALFIHIEYLKDGIHETKKSVDQAHKRIDELKGKL